MNSKSDVGLILLINLFYLHSYVEYYNFFFLSKNSAKLGRNHDHFFYEDDLEEPENTCRENLRQELSANLFDHRQFLHMS